MSCSKDAKSFTKPSSVIRTVRLPDSRVRATSSLELSKKMDSSVRPAGPRLDASSSSDSSSDPLLEKKVGIRRVRRQNGVSSVKVVPEGIDLMTPTPVLAKMRCTWITPYTESVNVSFHDEEWSVPAYNDAKLFELLTLSEALAELSWPIILKKRDIFRKLFENFDPSSVAAFNEKQFRSLNSSGRSLLSEQKLRAIIENARQILKVIEEFGSFSNYCWRFVNFKPMINGFRYARQVPIKTPKAEAMSKDMMQRGFLCVSPTVIYSFMQAAGIVNGHLLSCFRFHECIHSSSINDCRATGNIIEILNTKEH